MTGFVRVEEVRTGWLSGRGGGEVGGRVVAQRGGGEGHSLVVTPSPDYFCWH